VPQLSDLALKKLAPPANGRIVLWDDASPLGVRVTANGAKTFIVMLGSGKRYTIGRYGEVTLSQAREAARRLKAEKTLGRILPVSKSLADARKEYLATLASPCFPFASVTH
jgi:Arm DNA-binding domain